MVLNRISQVFIFVLCIGTANAASDRDELFANSALRNLHEVLRASAISLQAAKDNDKIGCQEGSERLQKAAHEALTNMHQMSFEPIDALKSMSNLLKVNELASNACPTNNYLLLLAEQIVVGLRTDYAIGKNDWYVIHPDGSIESKNPLEYAKSLINQNYSWVDVRPKGVTIIAVADPKSEMASTDISDSSLANVGKAIDAIEVGFRKTKNDENSKLFFYKTREIADGVFNEKKQELDELEKTNANQRASTSEWAQKIFSLPYMIEKKETGFKLIYSFCIDAGTNPDGTSRCDDEGSHDYTDNKAAPYHYFKNFQICNDASYDPPQVPPLKKNPQINAIFTCLPAPKPKNFTLKGYTLVFSLIAPGTYSDDTIYAELKDADKKTAKIFKTFDACYNAMEAPLKKALVDLGANENGKLITDSSKEIGLTAACSRSY